MEVVNNKFEESKSQLNRKVRVTVNEMNDKVQEIASIFKDCSVDTDEVTVENVAGLIEKDFALKGDEKEKVYKVIGTLVELQYRLEKYKYFFERNNLNEDGSINLDLSPSEMSMIKTKSNEIIRNQYGLGKFIETMDSVSSVMKSLGEKNIEQRIQYEITKSVLCNKYGYTPESVDKYINALKENNMNFLKSRRDDQEGIIIQSDATNKKFEYLLQKVENWNGEDPIYISDILEAYKSKSEEFMKNLPQNTEGAILMKEFISFTNKKKQDKLGKVKSKEEIDLIEQNETAKVSLKELRKQRRNKSNNHIEEIKPVEKPVDNPTTTINKSLAEDEILNSIVNKSKVEEKPLVMNIEPGKTINDVVKTETLPYKGEEGRTIPLSNTEVKEQESILDVIEDDTSEEKIKPTYNVDDVFKQINKKPDISILRSNKPDRVRKYKESGKFGRILYLTNSGYDVLVKRIDDPSQLNYILDLYEKNRLITNMFIQFEMIRVIYNHLEFFFEEEVSEIDFYKNLSPKDLAPIVNMIALLSTTERNKNGRPIAHINRVKCGNTECGREITLKTPITIDLYEKFKEVYDIKNYYTYAEKYRSNKPSSIYKAYSQSIEGKLDLLSLEEDGIVYNIVCGKPTYYDLSNETYKIKESTVYSIFKDKINELSEDELLSKYGEIGQSIKDKVNTELLISIQLEHQDLLETHPDIKEQSKYIDKTDNEEIIDIINRYKTLDKIINSLDEIMEEVGATLDIFTSIRLFTMTLKDTNEELVRIDRGDLYQMYLNLFSIPNKLFEDLTSNYVKMMTEQNNDDYIKSFIPIKQSEIINNVDPYSLVKTRDEYLNGLKKDIEDEEVINNRLVDYDKLVDNITKGNCYCGGHKFYIDHFTLLFFSLSHQNQE